MYFITSLTKAGVTGRTELPQMVSQRDIRSNIKSNSNGQCCSDWGKGCDDACTCSIFYNNLWNKKRKKDIFEKNDKVCFPKACLTHWYAKNTFGHPKGDSERSPRTESFALRRQRLGPCQ